GKRYAFVRGPAVPARDLPPIDVVLLTHDHYHADTSTKRDADSIRSAREIEAFGRQNDVHRNRARAVGVRGDATGLGAQTTGLNASMIETKVSIDERAPISTRKECVGRWSRRAAGWRQS